jgi:hypothetical protein
MDQTLTTAAVGTLFWIWNCIDAGTPLPSSEQVIW